MFFILFVILITCLSWTVITWIVVIGSSMVMIIWIPIYSFFESIDFNMEVVVLYGEVTFWATVIVSVVVALSELLNITPLLLWAFTKTFS